MKNKPTIKPKPMHLVEDIKDNFVKMIVNEPFDKKGVKMTGRYFNMPLLMLKQNLTFQRDIEKGRIKQIKEMIIDSDRFWSSSAITIDKDFEIIDGGHRFVVCNDLGIKNFPFVQQLNFTNLSKKVGWFVDSNKVDPTIKKDHYLWRAKHMAKHTDGILLYQLCHIDDTSLLFDYVSLAERKPLKTRITINSAWHIILKIGLLNSGKWELRREKSIVELINATSYNTIKFRINSFLTWFKLCFGEKTEGRIEWNSKLIQTYTLVYKNLIDHNLIGNKVKYNQSIKKFSKYKFNTDTIRMDQYYILAVLIHHFNSNKKSEESKMPLPRIKIS